MLSRQGLLLFFFVHFSDLLSTLQEKLSAKDKNSLEASGHPALTDPLRVHFFRWKVAQVEAIDNINCCVLEHLQEMGGNLRLQTL